MKINYTEIRFAPKTRKLIDLADNIIAEYAAQGFDLTLRQLYYQLVARDYIPNQQREYKKLVKTISDARMAGLISWTAIVDRTRELQSNTHWDDPEEILQACSQGFEVDKWQGQPYRPEVWIEKDALRGVIARICSQLDVPQFSCRGYNSQSEMWRAARRMARYIQSGQTPYIIHLADHDPSGVDMTRDIIDRLEQFHIGEEGTHFYVKRIALNHNQVEEYNPPPNPAKLTDSRIGNYLAEFGRNSWELDALEPAVIESLIREKIEGIKDDGQWQEMVKTEQGYISELQAIRDNYDDIREYLQNLTNG